MRYVSTRGQTENVSAAEAILMGLAQDRGLFVPKYIPKITDTFLENIMDLNYIQRAKAVLECYLTDYSEEELKICLKNAYGRQFDTKYIAPVHFCNKFYVLELWHGPTNAFKDMALQILPHLMTLALDKLQENKKILILVATSGDTGKAALAGFTDIPKLKIQVLYPYRAVSTIQYLDMATHLGENVSVLAVKGNFDDAQTVVKNIFQDTAFKKKLDLKNIRLSSANSINLGRLLPQIVYYFSAYADLVKIGKITLGDKINFCVPSGNFGNILAGFYAKEMGLPVNKFICASNKNHVLTEFLQKGEYNTHRPFYKTNSPSMDILISSNVERLLYHLADGNTKQISLWMTSLNTTGYYKVDEHVQAKLKANFWADWVDEETTLKRIYQMYVEEDYIVDPHTAVAVEVFTRYQKQTHDVSPTVILSTASPYKFSENVLKALKKEAETKDIFTCLEKLEKLLAKPMPKRLRDLKKKKIIHDVVCAKEEIQDFVYQFGKK